MDERSFLSALSFCMLLPGPEAMQLATYAGWRLHGTKGGRMVHVGSVEAPVSVGDVKNLAVEFKKAIAAGKSPQQAMDAAAVRMVGSTQYLALEGGRSVMQQSIEADERATGYARVTDNDPCHWCAMLASRGPVYKSAQTAGDPRQGGDRYHDHCGCVAYPSFSLNEPFVGIAEKLYDDWLRVTRGTGGRNAVNAWRRWWEAEGRAAYAPPERPGV